MSMTQFSALTRSLIRIDQPDEGVLIDVRDLGVAVPVRLREPAETSQQGRAILVLDLGDPGLGV